MRALGFVEDTSEGAPLCRWVHPRTILDVMPLDEKILGFSNRWYRAAMKAAVVRRLSDDLEVRMVTAPFFVVTKLEAFKGRGKGDFFGSRDLEDLVRTEINRLLATSGFLDALPGYLFPDAASQARISMVLKRLEELVSLKESTT